MAINPNNYPGANVTVVGTAGSAPQFPAYDKEGTRGRKEVSIAVGEGYKNRDTGEWVDKGTTWYTLTGRAEDLDGLGIDKGDTIRVDEAKQEVREYKNRDGVEKLGITLSFGAVTVVRKKQGGGSQGGFASTDAPF